MLKNSVCNVDGGLWPKEADRLSVPLNVKNVTAIIQDTDAMIAGLFRANTKTQTPTSHRMIAQTISGHGRRNDKMEEYKGYVINLVIEKSFQGMYQAYIPVQKKKTLIETNWFNIENEAEKNKAFREIKDMIETCIEYRKTYDERILDYNMSDKDKLLADIAQLIVQAYATSFKPWLIPKENLSEAPPYYKWKHGADGYSLISSEDEGFKKAAVLTTDSDIYDFVEHVFLVLAGNTDVKWTKIVNTSDAVKNALNKHFGMEVELSNVGYDHKFDMFGIPELPIKPTIWAKRSVDDTAFKEMEDKGFTYFDRDLWEITL